jgi:hypothetical protein
MFASFTSCSVTQITGWVTLDCKAMRCGILLHHQVRDYPTPLKNQKDKIQDPNKTKE